MRIKLDVLQAECEEHCATLEDLKARLANRDQELQQAVTGNAEQTEKISSLTAMVAEQKDTAAMLAHEHCAQLEELKSNLATRDQDLQQAGTGNAEQAEQIASLKAMLAEHKNSAALLAETNSALKTELMEERARTEEENKCMELSLEKLEAERQEIDMRHKLITDNILSITCFT